MYLWTDDDIHLVATGRGIARIDGDATQIHRFGQVKASRGKEPTDLDFFAATDAAGKNGVFGRSGAPYTFAFSDEGGSVTPLSAIGLRTAVQLEREKLIVCMPRSDADGRTRAGLFVANIEEDNLKLRDPLVWAKPKRIDWPSLIWAKSSVPWPEKDDEPDPDEPFEEDALDVRLADGMWQAVIRLSANPHGIVATSNYSGLIAVFDAASQKARFSVRVPTQTDVDIHAVATKHGVLVVMVSEGKDAGLFLLDPKGNVAASKAKFGKGKANTLSAPVLVDDDHALVSNAENSVHELTLPSLDSKAVEDLGGVHIYAAASSRSLKNHIVANGEAGAAPNKQMLTKVTRDKDVVCTPRVMPDLREPEVLTLPEGPKRVKGNASLSMLATTSGMWNCGIGGASAIELLISNMGGPVNGIYVELGGPAVASGNVEGIDVRIGDFEAPLVTKGSMARCEIPKFTMLAGYGPPIPVRRGQVDLQPKNPTCYINVGVKGKKGGQGLLTVRVGPLPAGSPGSAMQGKTIFVGTMEYG